METTLLLLGYWSIFSAVYLFILFEDVIKCSTSLQTHHEEDLKKGIALPNYDTNERLLTQADQSHYTHPARIQGLYALEGESENALVSGSAALSTSIEETLCLYEHLCTTLMAIGRVAHWYTPTLYQATVDTAVTMLPGFPGRVKSFRWHPHLTGFLAIIIWKISRRECGTSKVSGNHALWHTIAQNCVQARRLVHMGQLYSAAWPGACREGTENQRRANSTWAGRCR